MSRVFQQEERGKHETRVRVVSFYYDEIPQSTVNLRDPNIGGRFKVGDGGWMASLPPPHPFEVS